jgi:homoserine dehydrogenase
MAEHGISLESIVQRRRPGTAAAPGGAVPVILITHATHEKSVRLALDAAVADGFLAEKPQVIRIERE